MSARKIFLTIFLVALLVACSEGQRYGRGYGRRSGYYQGNRGGNGDLAESQNAYNINYGEGDLNNNQRSQTAQGVSQENRNGPYRG